MDKHLEQNGLFFIWNKAKASKNLEKHGVSFEQATEAFFDPFLLVIDASPEEEVRDAIIGMDEHWNLLFVVHVCVEEERIRIISARKAVKSERRHYEN